MMEFNAQGHSGRSNPDGSVDISTSFGAAVHVAHDGKVELDLQLIKTVGLRNLVDVVSHEINSIASSISHVVKFANGGLLQFAYNSGGSLIDFSASKLVVTLSKDNSLLVGVPSKDGAGPIEAGG